MATVNAVVNVTVVVALKVVKAPVLGVPLPIAPGAAKVAPLSEDAFKFATLVVLETTSGAVPVAIVDVSCPLTLKLVPVAAPMFGVTSVGLVFITNVEPVPVCAATEVALPEDVIGPVKLALVVTLPAVKPDAVPVQFVKTPLAGVPSAGATKVLLESVSVPANVASVPLTAGRVRVVVAVCARVVLNAPVVAKSPARASAPVVTVSAVPAELTTTALLPFPVMVGSSAKPAAMAVNSCLIGKLAPAAPVPGLPLVL